MDFPEDHRQMASGWRHLTTELCSPQHPPQKCSNPESKMEPKAWSQVPARDIGAGVGHLVTKNTHMLSCQEAVVRDVGLCVIAQRHPPAAVKPELCFFGIPAWGCLRETCWYLFLSRGFAMACEHSGYFAQVTPNMMVARLWTTDKWQGVNKLAKKR